ncbi:putative UDP-glucose 4-epimerase [Hyphomonas johnsonii MHS-2]|uniref:Putative UDP-glucose 4-epimerase n=1 Tax=Hyphomonas johnsonii MHS-2 TaxID=1280950 RepID=A0A059FBG1_9PROT|nr:putative UDP-glucose 4-epimerase [Hyphomonas johnsonii MHS-2]
MIDVDDLAALLARRARDDKPRSEVMTPAGHLSLRWNDIADSAARVTGRKINMLAVPALLFDAAGFIADGTARITGRPHVFSTGKVRELQAGDWLADRAIELPTALDVTMARCLAPFLAPGGFRPVHRGGIEKRDV